VYPTVIFYLVKGHVIEIVRVVDGGRNLAAIFPDELLMGRDRLTSRSNARSHLQDWRAAETHRSPKVLFDLTVSDAGLEMPAWVRNPIPSA
jgi:hypothetical protein